MLLKIINLVLILAAISLGLWLLNKNFPATGQLEVNAVLGKDQPMISQLGPLPRVRLVENYQIILDSPVYFDLRSTRWFKQAKVELIYQEASRKLEGMAGKVGAGWQYQVTKPFVVIDQDDGFKKAIFIFDLTALYQQKNIRRFLISSLGEPKTELKIKSIKVNLLR